MKLYATSPSFGADAALFLDDAAFAIFFEGAAFAGAAFAGFFVAFGSGLGFSAFAFAFDDAAAPFAPAADRACFVFLGSGANATLLAGRAGALARTRFRLPRGGGVRLQAVLLGVHNGLYPLLWLYRYSLLRI